jgi:biotin carboxyl carrier protein
VKAAVLLLVVVAVFQGARTSPPPTEQEIPSQIITTPFGGTVINVLAKAGDRVTEGQILVRLHAGELEDRAIRAIDAFEKTPLETLDRGAALIERVPAQTWSRILASDPERLAAAQAYVLALAAHDQSPTAETEGRLHLAETKQKVVEARVARRDLFEQLVHRYRERAADVAWLRKELDRGEVRSPSAGTILILDLHPGDRVAPTTSV